MRDEMGKRAMMRAGAGSVCGRERYIGGAVLRYDLIALSLDQE